MLALIVAASSPSRMSVVPDADTHRSSPGCRTSTVIVAVGQWRRFTIYLLAEDDSL
jgi:hypothetical protein